MYWDFSQFCSTKYVGTPRAELLFTHYTQVYNSIHNYTNNGELLKTAITLTRTHSDCNRIYSKK